MRSEVSGFGFALVGVLSEFLRSPPRNFCVKPVSDRGWAQLAWPKFVGAISGFLLDAVEAITSIATWPVQWVNAFVNIVARF